MSRVADASDWALANLSDQAAGLRSAQSRQQGDVIDHPPPWRCMQPRRRGSVRPSERRAQRARWYNVCLSPDASASGIESRSSRGEESDHGGRRQQQLQVNLLDATMGGAALLRQDHPALFCGRRRARGADCPRLRRIRIDYRRSIPATLTRSTPTSASTGTRLRGCTIPLTLLSNRCSLPRISRRLLAFPRPSTAP